ncbi:MAG: exodeoxyribonuclease VII large subunit [Proteobacteria bacterium]|nr:MAG: exodeoxyribonuclease VII large subunit [Pseudomonadota bacterium]
MEGVAAIIPKPTTVSIPVVRAPAQVPYEDEAFLNELDRAEEMPEKSKEPKVLSVSDLNRYIKELLEGQFATIWLKAEISNFKSHTSGHFYFSLKDSRAQISAVMFRGHNSQLRFRPEDGMEVLVRGKVTVYEPRGNYQMFCEMMEPVGAGALQKAFEQLKAKLQKEGLFDESRKRQLPALPRHIAIVTSPTGAAIRDMLNVLGRRFKGAHVTVIPCKVQGDAAPGEIVEAIKLAQQLKDIDVMIVGRGGGSIEDLWAFNDERVARAIAATRVPVISAVGHEVDFTIADFVADLRAPTPSAAAELVVRNAADLVDRLRGFERSIKLALARRLGFSREQLGYLTKRLVDPQRKIQDASIRADELLQRLELATIRALNDRKRQIPILSMRLRSNIQNSLVRKKDALIKNMAVLDSLSPLKVLDRGFSMVVMGEKIITEAKDLKPNDAITIRMSSGSVEAVVTKTNSEISKAKLGEDE